MGPMISPTKRSMLVHRAPPVTWAKSSAHSQLPTRATTRRTGTAVMAGSPGGAQVRSGAWAAWAPPCSGVGGPATVAASTPQDLLALCDVGLWTSTSPSERAYVSSDGGARFSPLAARLPSACQGASTLATVSALVAAAGCGAGVVATFDGGASWSTVYTGTGTVRYVGFTTATQGVAIETPASSPVGTLLMTHDAGHSWTPASI